jgi:hypothetical protein
MQMKLNKNGVRMGQGVDYMHHYNVLLRPIIGVTFPILVAM